MPAAVATTRQRMIESALDLFHRQGVNATSVDQILAHSATGKGQFSHYFKSKDGLVQAVLHYLYEAIRGGHTPTGYALKTWADFEGWFASYIKFQRSVEFARSCPIGTIGAEITNEQKALRQDLRLFLDWSRGELARFFAEKKTAGELAATADPEGLADLCLSVMQGGMLLSKMRRSTDIFEGASTQALAYVASLRTKKRRFTKA